MTVLEVIQRSSEFLARKGVESPRLQIELLLAHVLGLPRLKLYLNFEKALTPEELGALRELLKRRGRHEPLQQIVGWTSFCGLDMAVNRHVLVPRPETELLAERTVALVTRSRAPVLLDFGTGSGCLAVAVAVRCPACEVHAVDISEEALEIARRNAARHLPPDRIRFYQGDGFSALPGGFRCDVLVSNPPYIPSGQIAKLMPEVRDYEPLAALDGGADGLDFFRRLAVQAKPFLRPGASALVELGDGQSGRVSALFGESGWDIEATQSDDSGRPRFLIARHP